MPPLEDRVEYPYQNIRTRAFCWGDGDKVRPLIYEISPTFFGQVRSGVWLVLNLFSPGGGEGGVCGVGEKRLS